MEFTFTFLKLFVYGLYLAAPLLLTLGVFIILIGQRVGKNESWNRYDALYWSFVTATTLGYGDFRPAKKVSKALAIAIVFSGLVCSGIIVAIAVDSALYAFKQTRDVQEVKMDVQRITE